MIILLALLVARALGDGTHVFCTEQASNLCYQDSNLPRFGNASDTAPVPDTLTLNVSGIFLDISWTQRESHLALVDGYSLEVTTNEGDSHGWIFRINSSSIRTDVYSGDGVVHFTFDKAVYYPNAFTTVTLYALPLYNKDHQDHYRIAMQEPQPETDASDSEQSVQLPDELFEESTFDVRQPPPSLDQISPRAYYEMPTRKVQNRNSCWTRIIVAVLASNLTTVLIVLMVLMAKKKFRKRKGSRNESESEDLLEKGTRQKESTVQPKLTRILVMAKSDGDNGYHKDIGFCLANTLKSAPGFQVACNLWMTGDLAGKGAASWTHDVMNTNDVIVLLCNGHSIEQSAPDLHKSPDAYTQLIKGLLNSVSYDKRKLLIACVEEVPVHSCFKNIDLVSLRESKSYNIAHSMKELLTALSPNGMDQYKKDELSSMYAHAVARLHQKYQHETVKITSSPDDSTHGNPSLYDKRKTFENFCHRKHKDEIDKKRRRNRSESASSGKSEHQFDSVYSSQYNSRTTISMTSEDTGYFDNSQTSNAEKLIQQHYSTSRLIGNDVLEELEYGV